MKQHDSDDPSIPLPPVAPLRRQPSPSTDSEHQSSLLRVRPLQRSTPPSEQDHVGLSVVAPIPRTDSPRRILDFDMETLAAGYADPAWVPDKITCISASWVGEDEIHSFITGQLDWWSREGRARTVLRPFYELLQQADMVTGHNIRRFDLRVFNAEAMRCGVEPIRRILVEDTMSILKAKGYKKGVDNIAIELGCSEHKIDMPWAAWDLAYEDPTWKRVIERCESDVRIHKQIRVEMAKRGWLKSVTTWAA